MSRSTRDASLFVYLFVVVSLGWYATDAGAEESRVVFEMEVGGSVQDVWNAFTTSDGLKSWMAPVVEIDFRVGGKMRSNYNSAGKLGDETTIENTILCYDPQRMLALKATGFPAGFPFVEAAKGTWTVFYFERVSESRTKITVVGLGYTDSEQSQKMKSFFATANKYSLEKLDEALKKE